MIATPSNEVKSVDVIKLALDILYFFVQDANTPILYGFNYQLGEFLNVALEEHHACSAGQWHRYNQSLSCIRYTVYSIQYTSSGINFPIS